MKIHKAYKTELKPNNKQRTALLQHAGSARWAYNWGLTQVKAAVAAGTKIPSAITLHKQLVILKHISAEQGGHSWLKDCSITVTNEALRALERAVWDCLNQKKTGNQKGFPQYKSRKRDGIGSFKLIAPSSCSGRNIKLPKLGQFRLKEAGHLPECGPVKGKTAANIKLLSTTVSERAGHWFVSVAVEEEIGDPQPNPSLPILGCDVGSRKLAVTSDGSIYQNPKALTRSLKQLARLQRAVSRKIKGSKNQEKAKKRVATLHYKISCIRRDALHKTSNSRTKNCSALVVEDLNVKGMLRNHKLARVLSDAGIGELLRQLRYKAQWRGIDLQTASQWYPSSKTCSSCGCQKLDLGSSETFRCCGCGLTLDRDLNAAINLGNLYPNLIACKTTVNSTVAACGEESSGFNSNVEVKLASAKQEIPPVGAN